MHPLTFHRVRNPRVYAGMKRLQQESNLHVSSYPFYALGKRGDMEALSSCVSPAGFEPAACRFGGDHSVPLSYGEMFQVYCAGGSVSLACSARHTSRTSIRILPSQFWP